MRERINKPRVFLSHARKDVEFIERIENDLRKCQIEPWRDQNEIRDGEPWQNVIFGEGLPTCDVIITYYTENSLASQMVSKEVDATLLRQLADNGIGFLPYVNSNENRSKLRLDIQALHCRVWNDKNYNEIFPSVVAEIWRRYMERSVGIATLSERNRRLELELKYKELQDSLEPSIFTPEENKEFEHLFEKLKTTIKLQFSEEVSGATYKPDWELNKRIYEVSPISLLIEFINDGYDTFQTETLKNYINRNMRENHPDYPKYQEGSVRLTNLFFKSKISTELKTLGLLDGKDLYSSEDGSHLGFNFYFSPKMYRFKYWLEYKNFIELLSFNLVEVIEAQKPTRINPKI